MSSITVGSIVVLMGIVAAFNVVTAGSVVAAAIPTLIFSVWAQRYAMITVDGDGVLCVFPGGKLQIPWSDIESIEGHRFSARLVRSSTGKRAFFSMLDPHWQERPVTWAIRAHLRRADKPIVE